MTVCAILCCKYEDRKNVSITGFSFRVYVTSYRTQERIKSGERTVRMTIVDEDMEYMAGHVVDGRNLYPATGYLVLVWETLALMNGELFTEVSVVFENVKFMRATHIPKEGNLEFTIMIQKGSGNFEIVESGAAIVSGRIYAQKDISQTFRQLPDPHEPNEDYVRTMSTKDVYKELRLRGYGYTGLFKGILKSNIDGTRGNLTWVNNWVTFMDTMLQMKILTFDTRGLYVPTRIDKLSIDSTKHYAILSAIPDDEIKDLPVNVYLDVDVIRSGGVEIRGLHASAVSRRNPSGIPVLEKYEFVPFFPKYQMTSRDILRTNIQLILENVQGLRVKVVELLDNATPPNSEPLAPVVLEALGDLPLIQPDILVISNEKLELGPGITVEAKKFTPDINALLLIGTNLLDRDEVLQQALTSVNERGFIISRENLHLDPDTLVTNLDLIGSTKTDTEQLVFLKKRASTRPAKFVDIKSDDDTFLWVDILKETLPGADKIVLISQNEDLSGIFGLVNCLRKEPGGEIVSCVAIMDKNAPSFNPDLTMYEEQLDKDMAINVFKDGQWGSYRHLQLEETGMVPSQHAYVNVLTYGDLTSLTWIQGGVNVLEDKQTVQIYYSSLNFRDTMIASGRISVESMTKGRLNQECAIGMEFAGRTNSGVRVMGMMINRCMSNVVIVDKNLIWPLPDDWSMEEGATIPVAYGTVFYALFIVGTFKPGCSVLIHAGTGGVGQAAIHICLYYGCTVYTTVGTREKREFIKKLFPQLTDSNIGNSRDTSFEELIMRETGGKGVDVILNSLAEDKLQASVRCLGYRGQFLEIGKFDIVNNNLLGMHFLLRECSFHGIMMDLLLQTEQMTPDKIKLHQIIVDHIKNGSIKPLCRVTFEKPEVEKAFRFMASGKHIGKVLLKIRDEEPERIIKPAILVVDALPRYQCHSQKTYIIIGGLGGFGLELTDWLILRGARKIVLNSRRGISNGYQSSRIKVWKSYGVQIVISKDDISTQSGCVNLLTNASVLGPVKAIFNLAVLLKDALFVNQVPETFAASFAPKARATKFLDQESRKYCPDLTEFVVFSSVSCGRGNAGQTNYGMANSIMERICEKRNKEGYPALAVQWGAVGEVGLVADMQEEHVELEIGGTLQQKISSCLATLDVFFNQASPVVSSMVVAEKRAGGPGDGDIAGTVASIMGLKDLKTVSHQVTLAELGMDSIMAVEIKQSLEREYEIILTAQDIRTLTFARLIELAAKREADASTSATNKGIDGLTGLKILVRNVGDEMNAAEPIVNMATMISDGKESHDEICETDPRIFMIPGIEGMAAVFESLSKRIKCKVTVLQLGYDNPEEDIPMMAERLLLSIRSRMAPKAPFILLGYSFGVAVTLEIAKVLESEGHIGRVFCIDGAPEFLEGLMKANLNSADLRYLQDSLLNLILEILVPKNKENIESLLAECDTWESKLELFLRHVPGYVKHSKQYQRAMATAVYGRLLAVVKESTKSAIKLKSNGILLRPKDTPPGIIIDENYGLHNYFENPVKVHFLEGNHITIIDNKDCANIINRAMLDLMKEAAAKETGMIINSFVE